MVDEMGKPGAGQDECITGRGISPLFFTDVRSENRTAHEDIIIHRSGYSKVRADKQ